MKQVMLFLMAAMLFAACNQNTADNNGKKGGLFGGGGKEDEGGESPDDNGGRKRTGKWSAQDRNQFLRDCKASMPGQQAGQVCDCILSKIEGEYASLAEADRMGGEAAGARISQQCIQEIAGGNYNGGDDYNNGGDDNEGGDDDGYNNRGGGGGNWTAAQTKEFVKSCVGDAKRNGLGAQQASSYCECMAGKIAQQYSYAQANKMTAADLQTPQWQQVIQACLYGGGQSNYDY